MNVKINQQAIQESIASTWVAHDGVAVDMKFVCDFGCSHNVISFYDNDGHVICTFKFESEEESERQFSILANHLDAFILSESHPSLWHSVENGSIKIEHQSASSLIKIAITRRDKVKTGVWQPMEEEVWLDYEIFSDLRKALIGIHWP